MNRNLSFTERCAVNALAVRDLNPGGHVLCTLDGMSSPMRAVAFGDINPDRIADIPMVFSDAAAAEARAEQWNERMPAEFRPALEIVAMPVERWYACYVDALDPNELFDEATSVPFDAPELDTHAEAAAMVAEDAYDEETI